MRADQMNQPGDVTALMRWFRSLSLRVWLGVGMAAALLPLAIVAVIGYVTFHNQISRPFRDVVNAQHRILVPLERIHNELWTISAAVNDFAEEGDEAYRRAFEATEREVAIQLKELTAAVDDHSHFLPILTGVQQQWSQLLETASQIKAGNPADADPALHRFEDVIAETARRLGDISETVRIDTEASHAAALKALNRLEMIAAVGGTLAVLFAAAGIYIIDRALINSTDKLVDGALRIAAGDRERDIDVQVPPELASVADAFNVMTKQIIQQENALAKAARTDSLTGLLNRREFDRLLAERAQEADEKAKVFALLMLDVDHFKDFNDEYGHIAGDEALRQIAETIQSVARQDDILFRYGGEEFAMLLPDIGPGAAFSAADRVRKAVDEQGVRLPTGEWHQMTVSVGVSVYGANESDPQVLSLADQALYEAKSSGRNTVKVSWSG